MTPRDLKVLRAKLGLRQVDLAAQLGVHRNAVGNWERGITPIAGPALKLLERMAEEEAWKRITLEGLPPPRSP